MIVNKSIVLNLECLLCHKKKANHQANHNNNHNKNQKENKVFIVSVAGKAFGLTRLFFYIELGLYFRKFVYQLKHIPAVDILLCL